MWGRAGSPCLVPLCFATIKVCIEAPGFVYFAGNRGMKGGAGCGGVQSLAPNLFEYRAAFGSRTRSPASLLGDQMPSKRKRGGGRQVVEVDGSGTETDDRYFDDEEDDEK